MNIAVVYRSNKEFGTYYERGYRVEISEKHPHIDIVFDFQDRDTPWGGDIKIGKLSLTREEATNLVAALNTFLHHPTMKNKEVEWRNKNSYPQ